MAVDMRENEQSRPSTENVNPSSGFEGFEKRLEVEFFSSNCVESGALRTLSRAQLDELLRPAECTIVSELHNDWFDSYVLSESSLFVYPFRVIIKTCGRTQLLKCIPFLLHNALTLSLQVCRCKYTRGTFIFPLDQPYPHTSFREEVQYLDTYFDELGPAGGKAYVLGDESGNQNWHIYSAVAESYGKFCPAEPTYTLEMCMTQLDRMAMSVFFNESGSMSGKEMTAQSGIGTLLPTHARICDFAFAPCGYSMNAMEGQALSTIHIAPEEMHSYTSFEAMVYDPQEFDLQVLVNRVVACFKPGLFVMSLHVSGSRGEGRSLDSTVMPLGYTCDCSDRQELSRDSVVTYHAFRRSSFTCKSTVIPQPLILSTYRGRTEPRIEGSLREDGSARQSGLAQDLSWNKPCGIHAEDQAVSSVRVSVI